MIFQLWIQLKLKLLLDLGRLFNELHVALHIPEVNTLLSLVLTFLVRINGLPTGTKISGLVRCISVLPVLQLCFS